MRNFTRKKMPCQLQENLHFQRGRLDTKPHRSQTKTSNPEHDMFTAGFGVVEKLCTRPWEGAVDNALA
jgi:hypothetical protein